MTITTVTYTERTLVSGENAPNKTSIILAGENTGISVNTAVSQTNINTTKQVIRVTFVSNSGGLAEPAIWGKIIGDLPDQLDLQAELDSKAPITHVTDQNNPHQVSYDNLIGSPLPPGSHSHLEEDITDLDKYSQLAVRDRDATIQADLDSHKIANNPHSIGYGDVGAAPLVHQHLEKDITDLDKYTQLEAQNMFVNLTGDQMVGQLGLQLIPLNPEHAASKEYVDNRVEAGEFWIPDVIRFETTPPAGSLNGDRYIIDPVATGVWVGLEQSIAQWNDPLQQWDIQAPVDSMSVVVTELAESWHYSQNSQDWVKRSSIITRHADLLDVTPDQHHSESHTHDGDGSGPVDHNRLLNIGTNTHDQIDGHIVNFSNPHATKHNELVGVTPDDHHNRFHDHSDPADGTIEHAAIINRSAAASHPAVAVSYDGTSSGLAAADTQAAIDEVDADLDAHKSDSNAHHAQAHLLYGPDHSDVDIIPVPAIRQGLFKNLANDKWEVDYRTKLLPYISGNTYYPQETVWQDGWLTSANKVTTDYPAPTPVGDPRFVYLGASPTAPATAKQVTFGTRYTWGIDGWVQKYRIYTVSGNNYTLYKAEDPLGVPIITQIISFVASVTGWFEIGVADFLVLSGTSIDLVAVVSEPDPTPTTFTGPWNYQKPNNASVPGSGQITHANKQLDQLRVHKTDNAGADRAVELLNLVNGDIVQIDVGTRWSIQAVTDVGAYVTLTVAPATQDPFNSVQTFTFETVTATPITRVLDLDWWLTNGSGQMQGLYIEDGIYGDIVPDNTAYGTDIFVQEATLSPDWDVYGAPGGAGGGGGATFTPDLFTGAGSSGYVPDPVTESGRFLQDDGTWQTVAAGAAPLTGFKNQIINGALDVQQRTVFSSSTGFDSDRWYKSDIAGGTIVRVVNTYPGGAQYRYQVDANTPFLQRIENHFQFVEGDVWTLSYRSGENIYGSSSTVPAIRFSDGTNVIPNSGGHDLATFYGSVIFTIPAKVSPSYFEVIFPPKNNQYNITDIQFEKGSVATPFERRPYQQELVLCQRYYHAYSGGQIALSPRAQADGRRQGNGWFPVEMRAVPAIADISYGSVAVILGEATRFGVRLNTAGGLTDGDITFANAYTADAEL